MAMHADELKQINDAAGEVIRRIKTAERPTVKLDIRLRELLLLVQDAIEFGVPIEDMDMELRMRPKNPDGVEVPIRVLIGPAEATRS